MGIPKYYRWISERYPCLSEKIKDYQIPEFDNLYLDMNGIIHACSHPNDEDIHLRIPEDTIFRAIFSYIEFLFKMIKPQKVFFMAVDGVAPRAKMNQQRGRRFRSAKLAEDQEAEAIRKGETLPSEERFDSNCITPGTPFMARLQEHLKYFVQVKISTDPLWQTKGLTIYLSGHDVPGEGEHKVMDFIRHIRAKPDYDPSTRHCLYGLDADLIMLGLSTHELRFSLLREEVKFSTQKRDRRQKKVAASSEVPSTVSLNNVSLFDSKVDTLNAEILNDPTNCVNNTTAAVTDGKTFSDVAKASNNVESNWQQNKAQDIAKENQQDLTTTADEKDKQRGGYRAPLPNKLTFYLLHLSLLRDYIDEEFQPLRRTLEDHPTMEYNLEKILDDWILMSILVGNDFVPHLPNLHITKGALPMLYRTYMNVIPTLGGYLNENGILNLKRFEGFIRAVSQYDLEVFRETYDDMQYMESKTGKNIVLGEKMFEDFDFDSNAFEEEELEPMNSELKDLVARTNTSVYGENENSGTVCNGAFSDDEEFFGTDDSSEMRLEFCHHKRDYYLNKIEVKELSKMTVQDLAKEYVRAVQWVLLYYYKGVSSWGWYYPYHYAPYTSDLKNFRDMNMSFTKGQPFKPFQQLLGVLPAQSKKLLPRCYQWLMTEAASPILEFYPEKFTQDLNGKKQDWEAVVLIPFIDEKRLLEAMDKESSKLNEEEIHRNSKGVMLCYSHTSEDTGIIEPPAFTFPPMRSSNAKLETVEDLTYDPHLLPKGLHHNAKPDLIYQGFPTLKSIPHVSSLEKAEVKIFEFLSREESAILEMPGHELENLDIKTLAKKIIGKTMWVNWPHLTYVFVTSVISKEGKFLKDRDYVYRDNEYNEKMFNLTVKTLLEKHLKCKGIRLNDISVIVGAKMMEGRKIRVDSRGKVVFDVQWCKLEQPYALATSIYDEHLADMFSKKNNVARSYTELFPIGDQVFSIGECEFGNIGIVKGYEESSASVIIEFPIRQSNVDENNLKHAAGIGQLDSQQFYPSYKAAAMCSISSYVLGRLTGSLFITVEKEKRKKISSPKKTKKSTDTADAESSGSDISLEEFPALPEKKKNVGLDLKFNKKSLEVRGYTRKKDQMWMYSTKAIQLVNEFVSQFSDFVRYMNTVDRNKESLHASEIFPEESNRRIDEMIEWLEKKGVRDLQRIPMNTNILDDDDIDRVWTYIEKNTPKETPIGRIKATIPSKLVFKSTLNHGCVDPIPGIHYEILDRIVCVDRGAPMSIGDRGTVVGLHTPDSSDTGPTDDSFKSTSSIHLLTLFVLCDPTPSVFDKSYVNSVCDLGSKASISKKDADQMSTDLAMLLRIKIGGREASDTEEVKEEVQKPRIVNLYPFQVINLSKNIYKNNGYNVPPRNSNVHQNHARSSTQKEYDQRTANAYSNQEMRPFVKILTRNSNNDNAPKQPVREAVPTAKVNNKPVPPFNKKGKEKQGTQAKETATSNPFLGEVVSSFSKPSAKIDPADNLSATTAFKPMIHQNIYQHPFPHAQITNHIQPQRQFNPAKNNVPSAIPPFNTITESSPLYVFLRPSAPVIQQQMSSVKPVPLPQIFYPLPPQRPQFPSNYNSREKNVGQSRPPAPPVNWVAPTSQAQQQYHGNHGRPLPQRHPATPRSYNSYPSNSQGFVPLQVDRARASGSKSKETKADNVQKKPNNISTQSQPGLPTNTQGFPVENKSQTQQQPKNTRMAANFGNF